MAGRHVKLEVYGRVQGVFFRQSALAEARKLGVKGWVRNTPSGTVELCVEGLAEQVEELIRWCRVGPPSAQVSHVDQREESFTGTFEEFRIAR
ncbi:MAG: acylphosphatase [Candidatus Tectomicrobia bacterium]|nr:acylphosphatase [Candidatus Tectomicrobia bacterium]